MTPWYPSDQDAMSGLFVYKHAEAVRARGVDVRVIYAQTLSETWHQWRQLQDERWTPDIVQLNVLQKQGLLALWLKHKYGIPFILVEHWSGYLPENGTFMQMAPVKQKLYRHLAAQAAEILTVSEPLQHAMQACGIRNEHWGLIDNVVDDCFFEKPNNPTIPNNLNNQNHPKTLLYVSCFDEQAKNAKGLLRAAKILNEKRQDWRLVLVGYGVDFADVRRYAEDLDIPDERLVWTGELAPNEVAEWMHRSDALVLSSRYETYGVVLAEAAAAGLPILSTPVGIAEQVADLIVPQEIAQNKPGTFAEFMESMLWKPTPSPSMKRGESVSHNTDRFTAKAIGKKLKSVYDSCLHRHI